MSICGGIAGNRGRNPIGIFIHNDAGGSSLNANYWANALASGRHNLENGFAHAYAGNDGVVQTEDDWNCAWHCGDSYCNTNYLSIEVCQSMGDLNTFKANEEKALKWCADKCKQYGITPNANTIRLHKEVFATACPHRSVEIHGGDAATKDYFIRRITELMSGQDKWIHDSTGWWYRYADGSYPKNSWLKLAGEWYYFDNRGYAIQNNWAVVGSDWYYFNDSCKMVRGFMKDRKYWYYLNPKAGSKPEGAMLTGWVSVGGTWYFFRRQNDGHPLGSMVTGFIDDGDYTYYFRPSKEGKYAEGSMVVGFKWIEEKKAWYYFNPDLDCQAVGSMMRNHWAVENGKRYYLKDDGKMACNETLTIGGKKYTFDKSGAVK